MSSPTSSSAAAARGDALCRLFTERIVVLDGAMGTLLQERGLTGADHRCDLLNLTRPDVIEAIHADYYAAGADIVQTNTFSSTPLGQAAHARKINLAAATCARRAADKAQAADGRQRFVAGTIGPLAPAETQDRVVASYTEQIEALLDGGVDALLVETICNAPTSHAALSAIEQVFTRRGLTARIPVMLSVTLNKAGCLLSGETLDAFYQSVASMRPFSIGINCSFGSEAMRPHIEALSRIAECYTSCHPSAGLPNAAGGYDETPASTARVLGQFAANGWVNMVGGCCGTTPAHIAALAEAVKGRAPRMPPQAARALRFSDRGPAAFA